MGWVKQLDEESFAPTPITEAMKSKAFQACIKHQYVSILDAQIARAVC
jgi:hypothetical protein